MTEHWLPVVGYEGAYEVSDHGRVRSLSRVIIRSNGRRQTIIGRVLASFGGGRTTHQSVKLYKNGPNRTEEVHRLVLTAFVGPCLDGMECCHNDGDPMNNRLDNVRWDTRSKNTFDTVRHGTHNQASKTHCPQGHPYDAQNTYHKPGGRRVCRECSRTATRERQRRIASEKRATKVAA